jgi:hypothetical protein
VILTTKSIIIVWSEILSLFLQKINKKQNKEKLIQETQTKLKQAIEGCKEVIKVGSQFFNNENKTAAMTVWKVFCFGIKWETPY